MCICIFQVYRGRDTSHHIKTLLPKSEYQVRVCAIRICEDGSQVVGPYSPSCVFTSHSLQPAVTSHEKNSSETKSVEPKQLTDQQWAMIILFGFVVFAVLMAFVAQQIIAYTSSHSSRQGSS